MHEILVSEEECRHVARRGNHYAILPMLPELRDTGTPLSELKREYSSADSVLDLEQTAALLARHGLMIDPPVTGATAELLQ